eukprot:742658_1
MALWFNTTSNKITIISDPAVHLFDTTDHSFTAQAPTPTRITGYAFSKTFIGDTLYFNDYPKDNIGTYKLSTNQYTSPMSPSITTAVDWACLTSDNRYVYALGGLSTGAVDYFQVLDSSGNKWYTGSSLNAYRFMSACEIYQGTIYIFGGEYYSAGLRSIEKIFVGQNNAVLSNLATSTFQTIGATLHAPKSRMATAMCENVDQSLIYLIGGYNAYGGAEYATVELFDADTDTIVKRLSMKRARWQTSAICANGYIYVFGGYTKEGWEELNTWEVSNYLTEAPTASPTDGTVSPTKYPSQIPSVSPSKQPSASPSKAPTESTSTPSSSPSDPPSVSPTESPTSPSHAPTLVTMDPSSSPSLSPSSFPSVSPTLYPSLSPSSRQLRIPVCHHRLIPVYRQLRIPVCHHRLIPVYRQLRIPVCHHRLIPVYRQLRIP